MNLNDLLSAKGVDPRSVVALRHRPSEPKLYRVLPRLAVERPDLFNAYQQTQTRQVEQAMARASYVASFIGHEPRKALFTALYSIVGSRPMAREEYLRVPAYVEMRAKYGMRGWTDEEPRNSILWFDLTETDFYASWKGKLMVEWPPPERSWCRRAHRNNLSVLAILEESAFDPVIPDWREIELDWEDLTVLSPRWRSKLQEWRGIYYIFDSSDGKSYVGSAYGVDNLLGRWRSYAASGHGGNSLLQRRDPRFFRFTILQRVSPDDDPNDVIRLEQTWKKRLHTQSPFGLNEN